MLIEACPEKSLLQKTISKAKTCSAFNYPVSLLNTDDAFSNTGAYKRSTHET